jgi:protein TIF31
MKGSKERKMMKMKKKVKEKKGKKKVKVLKKYGWNKKNGFRKMNGDIMYIYLVNIEEKNYNINECESGFFVNKYYEEELNKKNEKKRNMCN